MCNPPPGVVLTVCGPPVGVFGVCSMAGGVVPVVVGAEPNAGATVRRRAGTSWNNNRPDGVADTFQVSNTAVECHLDDSRHILAKHPTGPRFRNNAEHFRPEVTVVRRSLSFPCDREGLAGEAAGEEKSPSESSSVEGADIGDEDGVVFNLSCIVAPPLRFGRVLLIRAAFGVGNSPDTLSL